MISKYCTAAVVFLAMALPARAEPTRIRNGFTVFVQLGKKREAAVALRPDKRGWRVILTAPAVGDAELRDVTPGKPPTKLKVAVAGRELLLGAERFVAGHVYRLELREKLPAQQLVYLYPPEGRRVDTVRFESGDEVEDGDGMPHTEKGSL